MNTHKLEQNPFFLLRATPRDNDQTILSKALDAKLLLGLDTKEAQNTLLNPAGRLESEIGFLPCVSNRDIEAVENWVKDRKVLPEAIPVFEPESDLARLNGVFAFLEQWPVDDPESACAACFALAGICDGLTPLKAMKDLNEDRKDGKRELLTHLPVVAQALEEHIHALCAALSQRCQELPSLQYRQLEENLSQAYCTPGNPYYRSPFLDKMVCLHLAHSARAQADEEKTIIEGVIDTFMEDAKKNCPGQDFASVRSYQMKAGVWRSIEVKKLMEALQTWHTLTSPERAVFQTKGITSDDSSEMFETVHAFLCELNNTYKDYPDAKLLVSLIEEVFTDLSQNKIDLIRKNKAIIMNNH